MILKRQKEHQQHKFLILSELTKEIKKATKKYKKKIFFLHMQLKDSISTRKQWAGIKVVKKKTVPSFTKLKDKNGNRIGPRRRAEIIVDYLEAIQWKLTFCRRLLQRT